MPAPILKKKAIFPNEPFFVHSFNSRKRASFALHGHDYFEVMLVVSGLLQQVVKGKDSRLGPGSLCFHTPETEHSIEGGRRGEGLHMINLALEAPLGQRLLSAAGEAGAAAFAKAQHPGALKDPAPLAAEMLAAGAQSRGPAAKPRLMQLLGSLLLAVQPKEAAARDGERQAPGWLAAALERLETGAQAPSLALLQDHAGRSREHLARSLRKYYGVSASGQVNQLKLSRARKLLEETDQKIVSLAMECGFENLSYFNRLFKQSFGKSPRDWRKDRARVLGA